MTEATVYYHEWKEQKDRADKAEEALNTYIQRDRMKTLEINILAERIKKLLADRDSLWRDNEALQKMLDKE